MKTKYRTDGTRVYFILSDLDPVYHYAARQLEFSKVEDGFARIYPADSPHLDQIYQNFTRHAEEMILQMAGKHSAPWEKALLAFLQRVDQQNIAWWLVGSTALAVRGLDIMPHDIDLSVDDEGAHKLGEILLDYLIEPVQDSRGWISNWFGRAFLRARIEWVGGVDPKVDDDEITDYGPLAASRREMINWQGYQIYVPPLDLQLEVSKRRGLTDRVEKIKRAIIL
jgi:hypothetical protein